MKIDMREDNMEKSFILFVATKLFFAYNHNFKPSRNYII